MVIVNIIKKRSEICNYYLLSNIIKMEKNITGVNIFIDDINLFKKYYKKYKDNIFFYDKNIVFGLNDIVVKVISYNKSKSNLLKSVVKNNFIRNIIFNK